LREQPPAGVNYGEANCQANQDYDWTAEKEFLHHNRQALAGLLGDFRRFCSLKDSVFIYPYQTLAMLEHPGLFLGTPPFSSFLLGFPGGLVPI
jgi:hypothetical protein